MMRRVQTAVIERDRAVSGEFTTEPFEAGWAGEARWFVKVRERETADTRLSFVTQISPDGLEWVDAEHDLVVVDRDGLLSWPVREFGQWLRIRGTTDRAATVMIYLTVKE